MRSLGPLGFALPLLFVARAAHADLEPIPSEGTVHVDLAPDRRTLRIENGSPIAIVTPSSDDHVAMQGQEKWPLATRGARIDLGGGKSVVHIVLPIAGGAYEVLASSNGETLFSGITGTVGESQLLRLMAMPGRAPTIVRAKTDDRVHLCGQAETLLAPQGLDPKTWSWKRASLQQLSTKTREAAIALNAEDAPAPSMPPVLMLDANVSSSGEPRAATDGDPTTAWREERSGIGQGEFFIARAQGAPLRGLTLLLGHGGDGADAPAAFYVLTDGKAFHVSAPQPSSAQRWTHVPFPEPVSTSCLAVILDTTRSEARDPTVGIREVYATTDLDANAELPLELARLAVTDENARRLLGRASSSGRTTLARDFWNLTPEARRAVIETLEPTLACEDMAHLEALALADAKLAPLATRFFDRCTTRATRGLLDAFDQNNASVRGELASTVALLARHEATPHLMSALGQGNRATRARIRAALARILAGASAEERAKIAEESSSLEGAAFIDLLSAFGPRVVDHSVAFLARTKKLVLERDVDTRWDLTPLLGLFVDKGALVDEYTEILRDNDPALRVLATKNAPARLIAVLGERAMDPSPRVREAALERLTQIGGARESVAAAAMSDDFAFVRIAAARALTDVPGELATDTLVSHLNDPVLRVRVASLDGLAARASTGIEVFERLAFEATAPYELRVGALQALENRCRTSRPSSLEALARKIGSPVDQAEYRVSFAAFAALARTTPPAAAKIRAEVAATGKNPRLLAGLDQALASRECPTSP